MAQLKDLIVNGNTNLVGSVTLNDKLYLRAGSANNSNIGPNGISWDSSSLPNDTSPAYVCTINAFDEGGRQMWTSIDTLKSKMYTIYTGSIS